MGLIVTLVLLILVLVLLPRWTYSANWGLVPCLLAALALAAALAMILSGVLRFI